MVQFLCQKIFFLDFFNFCWVFQKFPFFVSLCRIVPQTFEEQSSYVTFPYQQNAQISHKHALVISLWVTAPTFAPHQSFRFLSVVTLKTFELLKRVVAVKECIRGGGRHLQDVIFKH